MKRTQRQYLADLLDAMATAEHFVEGMTLEQLADDRRTQLALERLFGIIGEAAGKVSPELKARYPEVPWSQMVGMRNHLVHGYWAVKLNVVWYTIRQDLPPARHLLKRVFDELPPEDNPTS